MGKRCWSSSLHMGQSFKNGQSKICGRQPLKNLKWYGLIKQTISQPAITCSKLTIETLEQGVKYVQS